MCDLIKVNRKNRCVEIVDFPSIRIGKEYVGRLTAVWEHFSAKGVCFVVIF